MSTVAIIDISSSERWGGYIPFSSEWKPPRSAEYTSRGRATDHGSGPYYRVRAKSKLVDSHTGRELPPDHAEHQDPGGYKPLRWQVQVHQEPWGFWYTQETQQYKWGGWQDYGGHKYEYIRDRVEGNNLIYHQNIYYRREWTSNYVFDYTIWNLYATGTDVIDVSEVPTERPFYDFFLAAVEAGYIHPSYQQYFSTSFMEAASALPQADVNLIGNIKEAFEYIKGAIDFLKSPASSLGDLFQSFADPKNLWLQYRYVYKTNQMDAKELTELVSRLDYLSTCLEDSLTTEAYTTVGDTRFGVTMRFPIASILPQDVVSLVEMFGAQITPSNIWDMIPFSFMVDWFAGIGDKLSFFEDWVGAVELEPDDIWYIIRREYDWGSVYVRIPGVKPVVPPVYTPKSASGKAVTMRIADTVSIFT